MSLALPSLPRAWFAPAFSSDARSSAIASSSGGCCCSAVWPRRTVGRGRTGAGAGAGFTATAAASAPSGHAEADLGRRERASAGLEAAGTSGRWGAGGDKEFDGGGGGGGALSSSPRRPQSTTYRELRSALDRARPGVGHIIASSHRSLPTLHV